MQLPILVFKIYDPAKADVYVNASSVHVACNCLILFCFMKDERCR